MPPENCKPDKPATAWRIEMLGGLRGLRVESPGSGDAPQAVERFRTHRTALLLARLALFPRRTHAREELADLLWPDTTTERGRASLTQTLVYLRQALDEPRTGGLLTTDHKAVRVTRGLLQTDVAEWEAEAKRALTSSHDPRQHSLVAAAIAGYTGDLLPGFYDDWVCAERLRLATLHDDLKLRLKTLSASPLPDEDGPPKIEPEIVGVSTTPTLVNVPLYLTRFFGRDDESARVCELLRGTQAPRLLTLLGMGGIGKTRLAAEIGHAALTAGEYGAPFSWAAFVPLAEARTGAQMEAFLLHVPGIPGGGTDGLAAVIDSLNSRAGSRRGRLLLLLDNLEQLGAASAAVVARLLTEVPTLTILVTSRQPVGIAGEQEIPVGPLCGAPCSDAESIPEDIQLFVDRARLVRPDFALVPANRSEIARLCRLLEGIPLALELAATWVRVLTPSQIAGKLKDRFALLASRRADGVPERHRSLHAAIAWSYELLEPALRTLFAQLSVFRGGWTAEAAQVLTSTDDLAEPLLLLAERSLIQVEEAAHGENRPPRYRMLESLREFGDERLKPEEHQSLALRHLCYFEALSRKSHEPERAKARSGPPLLADERDNLRSAIVFGLAQIDGEGRWADAPASAMRIVLQSERIWTTRELEQFLDASLTTVARFPCGTRASLEAELLLSRGTNALHAGDPESAARYLNASLALAETSGDAGGALAARGRLANLAYHTGDAASAVELWTDCLAEAVALKNERIESALLNNLAIASPDLAARRRFGERAVALSRIHTPSSHLLASSLNTLANAAREQQDFPTALASLEEALTLASANGANGMKGVILTSFVEVFLETGSDLDRAQELLGTSKALFEELGAPTRVAEVHYLGFRLALARRDADTALDCVRQHLQLSRRNGADAEALTTIQTAMSEQLRTAGFDIHARQLAGFSVEDAEAARDRLTSIK